jgi:hypothetical protein
VSIPCILAFQKDSLIRLTLVNLVDNADEAFVLIDTEAENLEELDREINQYHAKVIILENSSPFAEETSLSKLLVHSSKLLVIVIQEDNNWLDVYSKDNKLLTSTTDLLDVIKTVQNHPL